MPHDAKDDKAQHWHEPAGTRKAGFGEFKKQPTPYDAFMEAEGIPVFRGIGISRVQDLPSFRGSASAAAAISSSSTAPRPNGAAMSSKCRRGGALNPEKHMYEEIFLVVEGRGTTEVWIDGESKKHVFEWQTRLDVLDPDERHAPDRQRHVRPAPCCSPARRRRTCST